MTPETLGAILFALMLVGMGLWFLFALLIPSIREHNRANRNPRVPKSYRVEDGVMLDRKGRPIHSQNETELTNRQKLNLLAQQAERDGDFLAASTIYAHLGYYSMAQRCQDEHESFLSQMTNEACELESRGRYLEAAKLYELAELPQHAEICREMAEE